jgi:hypothetical protein
MAGLNFTDPPSEGQIETQPNGVTYIYDGVKWSSAGSGGGGASVSTGENPPGTASDGDLWFNTITGIMYVYYLDDDSSQWVDVRPGGGGGGAIGDEAPRDGKQYGRQEGTWTETDNIPALPPISFAS